MTYFAVLAIGKDGPGIVAGLTRVLYRAPYSCTVERSEMMIMSGHFAAVLIASTEQQIDLLQLERDLGKDRGSGEALHMVRVTRIDEDSIEPLNEVPTYSIDVDTYSAEALCDVATLLADRKVNIAALCSTRDPEDEKLSSMALDVQLPPSMKGRPELEEILQELPGEVHFEVRINQRTDS